METKESDQDLFIEVESTYRPYANSEEMDAEIKKHGSIVKNLYGRRLTITGYDHENVTVGMGLGGKYETLDDAIYCACPLAMEVWLWLWRDKNIRFDVEDLWDATLSYPERGCASNTNQLGGICTQESSDPEEAIIAAIEYLVDNKLFK